MNVNVETRNETTWLHHGTGHPIDQRYDKRNQCLTELGTPKRNVGIGPTGLGTLWGTGLFSLSGCTGEFFFLFLWPSPGRGCGWLQPPLVRT